MKNVVLVLITCLSGTLLFGQPLQYKNVGPSRGGRVTAVSGVEQEAGTFYMGASGGGLWKSIDYGANWNNISDGYFATPSIGSIAVYQKNPSIMYVGTGSDAIRSNVIVGKGMYKSVDAGKTWQFSGLKDSGQIGSVIIHPDKENLIYVAVVGQPFRKSSERGVYRSKDAGVTWDQVLHLSDSVGAVDLEMAPDNPDIIYASMWRAERKPWTIISGGASDGVFKSKDGGDSWSRKTKGLPTGLVGKIDFAVSAEKPSRVWALVQADKGQEGLYKSDDYAESWIKVEMPKDVHTSMMYRPFYFTNLDANPQNADNLWAGTKDFWTTYNGGVSWKKVPSTHADHHDLWINPNDTTVMIEGNDGGGSVSRDGGQLWSTLFNQPTAELYSCQVDDQYPYYIYSGQQDNSTIRVPASRPYLDVIRFNDNHNQNEMMYWENCGGCETGPVIPKPGDADIVYANCKGQFSVYYKKEGVEQAYYIGAESLYSNHPDNITYRFQRVTPMEVSPHDPEVVYYGSQYVHRTADGGKTWSKISPDLTANEPAFRMRSGGPIDEDISGEEYYAVLYAIRESSLQQGLIWTGSNDGRFHVTKNGGQSWKDVTPEMPKGGRVSNIEVSPHDPAKAYYAVYRDYLGDDRPYVYGTQDYGENWQLLTDGLPIDFPARVIREDPNREGLLYAGTEFGLFISFNGGDKWQPFQRNLPIVPVTDIRIHRGDLVLSTLGRSFWIMEDISPLWAYEAEKTQSSLNLFTPRTSIGDKMKIHFQLPSEVTDSLVQFEFYTGEKLIHKKQESLSQLQADSYGIRNTEWDFRYYLENGEKDFQGPRVAPGTFEVRISYDGVTQSKSFEYDINPEIKALGVSQEDLKAQEDLTLKVAELLVKIKQKITSLEEKKEAYAGKKRKVELLDKELNRLQKGPKRYDEPQFQEHVAYLYKMLTKSPQKPGEDAYKRYESLKKAYDALD